MLIARDDLQASNETATVDGCITTRLEPALAMVQSLTGQRPILLGYCLGGLLTVALASRTPDDILGHILMATPWDFHGGDDGLCKSAANMLPLMEPLLQTLGALPIDAVQMLFYALDPFQVIGSRALLDRGRRVHRADHTRRYVRLRLITERLMITLAGQLIRASPVPVSAYFIVVVIVIPRRSSKAPLRQLHVVEQLPVRLAQTLSSARARPFRELA